MIPDVTHEEYLAEIARIAKGEPGWSQQTTPPAPRLRPTPTPARREWCAPLTPVQTQCLRFLVEYLKANGYAPTFREIASALGISSRGRVWHLLRALEGKGWIQKIPHSHNGITILAEPPAVGA